MSVTTSISLSERDQRAIDRLLESIDKASQRNRTVFERQRRHHRKPYRCIVSLRESGSANDRFEDDNTPCHVGWAYSLSQGGIGFISTVNFLLPYLGVGIPLPDGSVRWVTGMIVRQREIPQERFIDYGVAFGAKPAE